LRRVEPGEGEEPIACILKAAGDGLALEPPLAEEGFATGFDLGCGIGVDHVPVVFGQLLLHVLGSVAQKIAVLVNRAALNRQVLTPQRDERSLQPRGTVDDYELGFLQAARIEVFEEPAPSRRALPAHVLNG